jgi:hypothetical protein
VEAFRREFGWNNARPHPPSVRFGGRAPALTPDRNDSIGTEGHKGNEVGSKAKPEYLPVHIKQTIWFGSIKDTKINSHSVPASFSSFASVKV